MLTCNKNFVDLTVWILGSWTCIKLNVYATSESGEGKRARRRIDIRPNQPHLHNMGSDWNKRVFQICMMDNSMDILVLLFASWMFEQKKRVEWRSGWTLEGSGCFECSSGSYIQKENEGFYTVMKISWSFARKQWSDQPCNQNPVWTLLFSADLNPPKHLISVVEHFHFTHLACRHCSKVHFWVYRLSKF